MLDGTFPGRLLGLFFLGGFTGTNKGVGEIVVGLLPEFFIFRKKRFGKMRNGLVEFPQLVSGRTGIKLQGERIRFGLETFFKSDTSLLILPRPVILKPVGSSVAQRSATKQQGEQYQNQRPLPTAIPRQNRKHQTQNRNPQWPLVALYGLTGSEDPVLGEFHWLNAFLEYLFGRIGADGHKKSPRGSGYFVQASGIQLGIHWLSRSIAHEILPPILCPNGNKGSCCRTDPNGENPNPLGRRLFGSSDTIGIQLLPVG